VTSPASETEASYGFSVNVSDGTEPVHSSSTGASYVVEVTSNTDTETPSVPTGLVAEKKGKNIKLSWNASTDNVGVSGYAVWRDGARIADTTETGYVDKSAPSGSSCSYSVSAYDAAGNMSPLSSAVTVAFAEKTNNGKPK
jgi:fibronectin type 3 domain-containing protein